MPISDAGNISPVASPHSAPIVAPPSSASALSADAYLSLASQYVYRGVALRDSGPVATASLAVSGSEGWFIDAWGGRVDTGYGWYRAREWQTDVTAGYGAEIDETWRWSLARAWVNGFGGDIPESLNYQEWRGNVFFRESFAMQFAYTENYRQLGWSAWNIEANFVQPLTARINGEFGAGRSHGAGGRDNSYSYVWLGAQAMWLGTQWGMRWTYSGAGAEQVLGDDRAGSRVELSATWRFSLLP